MMAKTKTTPSKTKKTTAKKKTTSTANVPSAEPLPPEPKGTPVRPPLGVGDLAPTFDLESDDGRRFNAETLAGQRFVLYFYPRDNTPGCTQEACDFRDASARFDEAGLIVIGVSGDSLKSHERFREKHGIAFPLLSDPGNAVAAAYGAFGEKSMYGAQGDGDHSQHIRRRRRS